MMNKRLFVGGLPFNTTEDELREVFSKVGVVESVAVITDKFSGRSKGFGFVEMATPEEAEKAIKELNETELGGRKLIVNEAKPREVIVSEVVMEEEDVISKEEIAEVLVAVEEVLEEEEAVGDKNLWPIQPKASAHVAENPES
jgi:RNA recognition motif-containing protein